MKILIINTVWTNTSTGKIAYTFYKKLLELGHEVRLFYGYGKANTQDKNVIKISTNFENEMQWIFNELTGYHSKFAPMVMKRLFKRMEGFKPDIVQLFNLHGNYIDVYKLLGYLKVNNICTVYGMLDEHPYTGYCCYPYDCEQFKSGCKQCNKDSFKNCYPRSVFFNRGRETLILKEKAYKDFENLIFTGPQWVIERATQSYLLRDKKLKIVDEFVDNEYTFIPKDNKKIRNKFSILHDKVIILNVAPSDDDRKGIFYFIELAKICKEEKYLFINVGYQGKNEGLPKNFIGIPFVANQNELAEYYSVADLLICTSIADTMPNVCLDALSCGTQVCGFEITGIPYVAKVPLGKFVKAGDVNALYEIVKNTVQKNQKLIEECRDYAVNRYSPNVFVLKMLEIYNDIMRT